ncbi:MAG: sulfatase-like hydrolase/transferase [Polyangiaceae bacterium]|nr:sulfatase-like hydrolase/transferase [Polyangiaceae bacterium]
MTGSRAPTRTAPERGQALARWVLGGADAFLVCCALLTFEVAWVGASRRGLLAGRHEIGWALGSLLPVACAAAVAPAAVLAVWLVGAASARRRSGRLLCACVLGLGGALVAWGGARASGLALAATAAAVVVGALVAGALAHFGVEPARVLALRLRRVGHGVGAIGAALVWALGCELASGCFAGTEALAWHLGWGLVAACGVGLAWLELPGTEARVAAGGGAVRMLAAALLLVGSFLGAPSAARALAPRDNVRRVYAEASAWLAGAVEVADELAPQPAPAPRAARGDARPTLPFEGLDVLLVTVGSMRADHVGAYGYARPTTPALDALAAGGVLFERAYGATPASGAALASLLTGKHLHALARQGLGADSESWAGWLGHYGYRTAAFAPASRWRAASVLFGSGGAGELGFAHRAVDAADDEARVSALGRFAAATPAGERIFAWIHLEGPRGSARLHVGAELGPTSLDRYDGALAVADRTLGVAVAAFRAVRPDTLVIATADRGAPLRDHPSAAHAAEVHEGELRVPLVVVGPGLPAGRRVAALVSQVDVLPTVLGGLGIPHSPRLHGRDLAGSLGTATPPTTAAAPLLFAETDAETWCAERDARLGCPRGGGACRLHDLATDPAERVDLAARNVALATRLGTACRALVGALSRYEPLRGADGESGAPTALRRGMAGERQAAAEVAELLASDDLGVRRKAAEVLFELGVDATAPALRRALGRESDDVVRRFVALALSRLGQGAPLALDLLAGDDLGWRRLAALGLAEGGDGRGEDVLVAWWNEAFPDRDEAGWDMPSPRPSAEPLAFERARRIAAALGELRSKAAILPLSRALADRRLAPYVAAAMAAIGEAAARPSLAKAFALARSEGPRLAIAEALLRLGGGAEIRESLVHFLGVPEPLPGGLGLAMRAGILELVGGPRAQSLDRLRRFAATGVAVGVAIPKGGTGRGFRILLRASSTDAGLGEVRVGLARRGEGIVDAGSLVPRQLPALDPALTATLVVPPADGDEPSELHAVLPAAAAARMRAGDFADFAVHATHNVALDCLAVVPLSEERDAAVDDLEGGDPE